MYILGPYPPGAGTLQYSVTGVRGTGMGVGGVGWAGGVRCNGPNCAAGHGGMYGGHGWGMACDWCSWTRGVSCAIRGAT